MREIGTTAGFLEIGDTFRTVGVPPEADLLVVKDLGPIHNRPEATLYACANQDSGREWTVVLEKKTPIVLCI